MRLLKHRFDTLVGQLDWTFFGVVVLYGRRFPVKRKPRVEEEAR